MELWCVHCARASHDELSNSPRCAFPQLRERLRKLCTYFEQILETGLRNVPKELLSLREREIPADYPSHVFSPIFPLISHSPKMLEDFLRPFEYTMIHNSNPDIRDMVRVYKCGDTGMVLRHDVGAAMLATDDPGASPQPAVRLAHHVCSVLGGLQSCDR